MTLPPSWNGVVAGLENLLMTYAGAMLINAIVSGVLWWGNRTALHRNLFLVWVASLLTFGIQGAFQAGSDLQIVLAFSVAFSIAVALANLIGELVSAKVPWTAAGVILAVGYAGTLAAGAVGAPFVWVALPVCVAGAFPMLWVLGQALVSGSWRGLTVTGRGLLLSVAVYVLHTLDFPFLRDKPEFAAMGFTIAILIVFAMSIFAPATVLEIVTERQARSATEMRVARHIQMDILPKDPRIDGLEISAFMRPAEEVGGDYYDVYSFGDHSWVLLGDVTGHGLSSGLVMLMAQSIISSILHTRPDISPAELNFTANHILYNNLRRLNEHRTMTLVAISREGTGNQFRFSGNHENIYVFRSGEGRVDVLDVEHIPHGLGMLDEFALADYGDARFQMQEGDLLFVASDGIREAALGGDYERGMFGEERLLEILRRSAGVPLVELKRRVLDELERFTGGVYHDDVSFLMARATR